METFNPVTASENIKESFVDYITTSFDIADRHYASEFRKQLEKEGFIAKGPYLDISGSYKTGHSINELIDMGIASPLFRELEPVSEKERELKLERPLYCHQEEALQKATKGNNLVVTTGTGSGKTECFLIPIINELLRQKENGTLNNGVRAMVIYPMNALANDQMKRMRKLLKNYPDIKFGLYNGNTEQEEKKAIEQFRKTNGRDAVRLPNELISREKMQETPPHILITNYSMLEYMMLRPKDDLVFSGARLRFVVLDEAHIYKGTTGMETAMLMRRLRARLKNQEKVQYILTSATLGGKEDDKLIVSFGKNLCGNDLNFSPENIIRSEVIVPPMIEQRSFPIAMFTELADEVKNVADVLSKYEVEDYAPGEDDGRKIYELMLHSLLYADFKRLTKKPATVAEIAKATQLETQQVLDFISVCSRAEKEGTPLVKARYHFFVRALEGAFVTLDGDRKVLLQRAAQLEDGTPAFEIAICQVCGRIALVGKECDGHLIQVARKVDSDPKECEYYLLWDDEKDGSESFGDDGDDSEELEETEENDFTICPKCGKLGDQVFGTGCTCGAKAVALKKVNRTKSGRVARCPACGTGSFRAFYLGAEAATAVLGTELYEQLPTDAIDVTEAKAVIQTAAKKTNALFKRKAPVAIPKTKKTRQFLCFSDSRSDAAHFATYMEGSYQEFLRRRGIWKTAKKMREEGTYTLSVKAFVARLQTLFENERTFAQWDPDHEEDRDSLRDRCRSHAWVAVLNELFNARRSTSLAAIGLLSFHFVKNDDDMVAAVEGEYGISATESKALLEQLALDGVYTGALDAGNEYKLSDAEREYIFFTATPKKLVLVKNETHRGKNYITGWAGHKRTNGNYYPNTRITRLVKALGCTPEAADEFLQAYWDGVLEPTGNEFAFNACDFEICLNSSPNVHVYQCEKCGKITTFNVHDKCSIVRCGGTIHEIDPEELTKNNHYVNLYESEQMEPLQIKEHTAQLSRKRQTQYQQAFVDGKINALSCSTTFEMGVDVGGLETVYMRDVPPSPANYVQRAGRAGRAAHTAAFVLTYAKLSSHDFTYYQNPVKIISGQIRAPQFSLENEKVLYRHIFAVAFSAFFSLHEDDVYDGNNLDALLNQGGYDKLKSYLADPPQDLIDILKKSIPARLHDRLGITDFSWTEKLVGVKGEMGKHGIIEESGALEIAVQEYRTELDNLTKALNKARKDHDDQTAGNISRDIKRLRCGPEDGHGKKSLIDFLARNNCLPKYGFPIDTVELQIGTRKDNDEGLQLARDLQMAIGEYAPGAEIIADGKLYRSRYIRKLPGKSADDSWEYGYYAICPECNEPNFTRDSLTRAQGHECISCKKTISGRFWHRTLEPRRGFIADPESGGPAPMTKPDRDYKTDDYYVGDIQSQELCKYRFRIGESEVEIVSTANDSLAVVGVSDHKVCKTCGYAESSDMPIPAKHKTANGYFCRNTTGSGITVRLSHTFKTDVAKVTFLTDAAANYDVMISVLYAMLEGISRELDVERTDIKGCLYMQQWPGRSKMLYSLVLYDAVAGGAGHVRRIATEDGEVLHRVIENAYKLVLECKCNPSCYQCLRNYYNQKIHDKLDRVKARDFLTEWREMPVRVTEAEKTGSKPDSNSTEETPKTSEATSNVQFEDNRDELCSADYSTWKEASEIFGVPDHAEAWDAAKVSLDCYLDAGLELNGNLFSADFLWPDKKTIIVEEMVQDTKRELEQAGWHVFDNNVEPAELAKYTMEE